MAERAPGNVGRPTAASATIPKVAAPKRTSSGTFSSAPLLNLLLVAIDRKLSGTLVFESPNGNTSVLLKDGAAVNVRPGGAIARLGELLMEQAGVHETTIELAARTRSGPALLGEKLIGAGVITRDVLDTALREQLLRRLLWAGRLPPETKFAFFDGANLIEGWGKGPIEIDPLLLIWNFIKVNATMQEVDNALAQLTSRDLKLHSRAKVQRFGFPLKAQGALDVLRARPQPLDDLLAKNLLDTDTLKRVLYTLAITRHLDLGRDDADPMGVPVGQSKYPMPPARKESHVWRRFDPRARQKEETPPVPEEPKVSAGLREELAQVLERVDSLTYYEMLGLPDDASLSAIQGAFLAQAKKWHPDRWRGELSELRDDAAKVFSRLSEAHQVLTDDEQRQEYDKLRKSKGQQEAEDETVKQVLRAASMYQKAHILAKKHDWAGAEELAKKAYDGDSSQAEYGAFYAWLVVQNPANKEKDFDALLQLLNRALIEDKKNVQIHFYRAHVLKRAGRVNEAMKGFRFVVDQDPKNLEAARELRLFKMRAEDSKSKSDPKGKGVLDKLFKR